MTGAEGASEKAGSDDGRDDVVNGAGEASPGLRLVGGGDVTHERAAGAGVGRGAVRAGGGGREAFRAGASGGASGGLGGLGSGRDWAELLRVSALFTVPGDALAGAAATGLSPNRRTLLAVAASLSLYEAGMALNDWADRAEDAVERPHRPLPSGRIAPSAALGAAAALTAGGLALAAAAGRPALTVATGLAATVWAYDLCLKHTPAGPAAMAAARSLDLLLGAAATSAGAAATGRRRHLTGRRPGAGVRAGEGGSGSPGSATLAGTGGPGTGAGVRPAASSAGLRLGAGVLAGEGGSNSPGSATLAGTGGPGTGAGVRAAGSSAGLRTGAGVRAGLRGSSSSASAKLTGAGGAGFGVRAAVPGALVLGAHTLAVTAVSRREAQGGSTVVPLAALAATAVLAQLLARSAGAVSAGESLGGSPRTGTPRLPADRVTAATRGLPGLTSGEPTGARHLGRRASQVPRTGVRGAARIALAATYAATAARPLFHAVLNPSPQLTQRAVGGGIRAMIPLQAALSARKGALGSALLTAALAPAARTFGRKVSVT
ncbi:UbiA family prenyltransferase [Streptomyces sp. NPDC055060]